MQKSYIGNIQRNIHLFVLRFQSRPSFSGFDKKFQFLQRAAELSVRCMGMGYSKENNGMAYFVSGISQTERPYQPADSQLRPSHTPPHHCPSRTGKKAPLWREKKWYALEVIEDVQTITIHFTMSWVRAKEEKRHLVVSSAVSHPKVREQRWRWIWVLHADNLKRP